MQKFYVLKESNTFADNLEAIGLAKIIKIIIQQMSENEDDDIAIEDYGGYFKLQSDYNITQESLDKISFFDFMPYVSKKNEKTGKLEKVGEKTEYQADPIRLLIARSLFTSRGVSYLDQVFDNDLQGFVKVLKTTTGIKPQQIDIEMYKAIKEKDKRRALEDLLIRTGELKEYRNVYQPK